MAVHSHTTFSTLDGLAPPKEHLEAAKAQGLKGLAITDHRQTSGWYQFEKAADEVGGITPMYGVELYWTPDRINDRQNGPFGQSAAHLLLLAKNEQGLRNINALVTDANYNGHFHQPRTDNSMLRQHHEGVIVTSGCLLGPPGKFLMMGLSPLARSWMEEMQEIFDKDFYLELQPHHLIEKQHTLNSFLASKNPAAREHRFVVTNDSHYPYPGDARAQLASTCVNPGFGTLKNPKYPYNGEFWVKGYETLYEDLLSRFDIPEWIVEDAVENLKDLTSRPRVHLPKGRSLVPASEDWVDPPQMLKEKLDVGLYKKVTQGRDGFDEYRERLRFEYDLIVKKGFVEYFLVVDDMVRAALDKGIMVGCGRGSASASLVSHLLGITDVDPVRWNLDFSRFLSPDRGGDLMTFHPASEVTRRSDTYRHKHYEEGVSTREALSRAEVLLRERCAKRGGLDDGFLVERFEREFESIKIQQLQLYYLNLEEDGFKTDTEAHYIAHLLGLTENFDKDLPIPQMGDMPDIDVDFEEREGVVDYLKGKYGEDKVAYITNYNEYKAKSLMRDIAKVCGVGIPKDVQNEIEVLDSIEEWVEEHEEAGDFEKRVDSEGARDALKIAARLEGGNIRQFGRTAAGVIVSSEPIQNYAALFKGNEGYLAVYDKDDCEMIGLLKMDVLKLKLITIMHHAEKLIRQRSDFKEGDLPENIWYLPYTVDAETREKMIAQFRDQNTDLIFQFGGRGLKPFMERLKPETIHDLIAANALVRPAADDREYIARKNEGKPFDYQHPKAEPILKDTFGVVVYQEQIMELCRDIADMYDRDVNRVRYMTAKKKDKEAEELGDLFVRGCVRNGVPEESALALWEEIRKSTRYAFNKAHCVAYFVVAWANMWFQVKYPAEWILANLLVKHEEKNMFQIVEAGKKLPGVRFGELNVNTCGADWSRDENNRLIPGLSVLPNLGMTTARHIVKEREKNGPFKSLEDMTDRMTPRQFNKRVQDVLGKAGALPEGEKDERFSPIFHKVYNFKPVNVLEDEGKVDIHPWWKIHPLSQIKKQKHIIVHGYVRTTLKADAKNGRNEREVYVHGDESMQLLYPEEIKPPGPYVFLLDSERYAFAYAAIPLHRLSDYPVLPEDAPDGYDLLDFGKKKSEGICYVFHCRKTSNDSYVTGVLGPEYRVIWLDHPVEPFRRYYVKRVFGGRGGKTRWETTPVEELFKRTKRKKRVAA